MIGSNLSGDPIGGAAFPASGALDDAADAANAALVEQVHQALADHVDASPGRWQAALLRAFGAKAFALIGRTGHPPSLPEPPAVRFLAAGAFERGAQGAYDASSGTLFLDASLRERPEALRETYAEEFGHHIDALLGGGDARGDEGAIFRQTLLGDEPTGAELARLHAEDDRGQLVVDGRTIEVEFYAPSADADSFDVELDALSLDSGEYATFETFADAEFDLIELDLTTTLPATSFDPDALLGADSYSFAGADVSFDPLPLDEALEFDPSPAFDPDAVGDIEIDGFAPFELKGGVDPATLSSGAALFDPDSVADVSLYEGEGLRLPIGKPLPGTPPADAGKKPELGSRETPGTLVATNGGLEGLGGGGTDGRSATVTASRTSAADPLPDDAAGDDPPSGDFLGIDAVASFVPRSMFSSSPGTLRLAGQEYALPGIPATIQTFVSDGFSRSNRETELYQVRKADGSWEVRARSLIPERTTIDGEIPDVLLGTYERPVDVEDFGDRGELKGKLDAAFVQLGEQRDAIVADDGSRSLENGDLVDTAGGIVDGVVRTVAVGTANKVEEGLRTIVATPQNLRSGAEQIGTGVVDKVFPGSGLDFTRDGPSNVILEERREQFQDGKTIANAYHHTSNAVWDRTGIDTNTYAFKIGQVGGSIAAVVGSGRGGRSGGGAAKGGNGGTPPTSPAPRPSGSNTVPTANNIQAFQRPVKPVTSRGSTGGNAVPAANNIQAFQRPVKPVTSPGSTGGAGSPGNAPYGIGSGGASSATASAVKTPPVTGSVQATKPGGLPASPAKSTSIEPLPVPPSASTVPTSLQAPPATSPSIAPLPPPPPAAVGSAEALGSAAFDIDTSASPSADETSFTLPEDPSFSFAPSIEGFGEFSPGQRSRDADTETSVPPPFELPEVGDDRRLSKPLLEPADDLLDLHRRKVEFGDPGTFVTPRRIDVDPAERGSDTEIETFPIELPNTDGNVVGDEEAGSFADIIPGDLIDLTSGGAVVDDPNLPWETSAPEIPFGVGGLRSGQAVPPPPDDRYRDDGDTPSGGGGSPRNVTPDAEGDEADAYPLDPETETITVDATPPLEGVPIEPDPPRFGYADPAADRPPSDGYRFSGQYGGTGEIGFDRQGDGRYPFDARDALPTDALAPVDPFVFGVQDKKPPGSYPGYFLSGGQYAGTRQNDKPGFGIGGAEVSPFFDGRTIDVTADQVDGNDPASGGSVPSLRGGERLPNGSERRLGPGTRRIGPGEDGSLSGATDGARAEGAETGGGDRPIRREVSVEDVLSGSLTPEEIRFHLGSNGATFLAGVRAEFADDPKKLRAHIANRLELVGMDRVGDGNAEHPDLPTGARTEAMHEALRARGIDTDSSLVPASGKRYILRSDNRSQEIVFAEGFKPRDPEAYSFVGDEFEAAGYASGNSFYSKFPVSAAESGSGILDYLGYADGKERRHLDGKIVYIVENSDPGNVNLSETIRRSPNVHDNLFAGEDEVIVQNPDGIPPERILGAFVVAAPEEGPITTTYVENANYAGERPTSRAERRRREGAAGDPIAPATGEPSPSAAGEAAETTSFDGTDFDLSIVGRLNVNRADPDAFSANAREEDRRYGGDSLQNRQLTDLPTRPVTIHDHRTVTNTEYVDAEGRIVAQGDPTLGRLTNSRRYLNADGQLVTSGYASLARPVSVPEGDDINFDVVHDANHFANAASVGGTLRDRPIKSDGYVDEKINTGVQSAFLTWFAENVSDDPLTSGNEAVDRTVLNAVRELTGVNANGRVLGGDELTAAPLESGDFADEVLGPGESVDDPADEKPYRSEIVTRYVRDAFLEAFEAHPILFERILANNRTVYGWYEDMVRDVTDRPYDLTVGFTPEESKIYIETVLEGLDRALEVYEAHGASPSELLETIAFYEALYRRGTGSSRQGSNPDGDEPDTGPSPREPTPADVPSPERRADVAEADDPSGETIETSSDGEDFDLNIVSRLNANHADPDGISEYAGYEDYRYGQDSLQSQALGSLPTSPGSIHERRTLTNTEYLLDGEIVGQGGPLNDRLTNMYVLGGDNNFRVPHDANHFANAAPVDGATLDGRFSTNGLADEMINTGLQAAFLTRLGSNFVNAPLTSGNEIVDEAIFKVVRENTFVDRDGRILDEVQYFQDTPENRAFTDEVVGLGEIVDGPPERPDRFGFHYDTALEQNVRDAFLEAFEVHPILFDRIYENNQVLYQWYADMLPDPFAAPYDLTIGFTPEESRLHLKTILEGIERTIDGLDEVPMGLSRTKAFYEALYRRGTGSPRQDEDPSGDEPGAGGVPQEPVSSDAPSPAADRAPDRPAPNGLELKNGAFSPEEIRWYLGANGERFLDDIRRRFPGPDGGDRLIEIRMNQLERLRTSRPSDPDALVEHVPVDADRVAAIREVLAARGIDTSDTLVPPAEQPYLFRTADQPIEAVFRDGFSPRDPDGIGVGDEFEAALYIDLDDGYSGLPISTAESVSGVLTYLDSFDRSLDAYDGKTVYVIENTDPGNVNLSRTVERSPNIPRGDTYDENEVAVQNREGIPGESILGAMTMRLEEGRIRTSFVPNEGYTGERPVSRAERRRREDGDVDGAPGGSSPSSPAMSASDDAASRADRGFSPSVPEERFVSDRSSLDSPYRFETLDEAQTILDGYGITLGPIEESNFDPDSEFADPTFGGTYLSERDFADSLRVVMPEIIRIEEKYPGLLDGLHLIGMENGAGGYAYSSKRSPEIALGSPDTFAEILDEESGRVIRSQRSIQAVFRHELGHFILHNKLSEETRERLLSNNAEVPLPVLDDRHAMGTELDFADNLTLRAREVLFKTMYPGSQTFTEFLREQRIIPENLKTEDIDPDLLAFVIDEVFGYELEEGGLGTLGIRFPKDASTLQIGENVSQYASFHNNATFYPYLISPDNTIGLGQTTVYEMVSEEPGVRDLIADYSESIRVASSLLNRYVSREESYAEIFGAYLFDGGEAIRDGNGNLVNGTASIGERGGGYRLPDSMKENLESALREAQGVVPEPLNNGRDFVPTFDGRSKPDP